MTSDDKPRRKMTFAATRSRRAFLATTASALLSTRIGLRGAEEPPKSKAKIAITLDLEMSRNFPDWEDREWDYKKGDLNEPTKKYATGAGDLVRSHGGVIHYFLVGRALEQPNVDWLIELIRQGHPIGNHTYDHVHMKATDVAGVQFRFQRSPWLVSGKSVNEILVDNIRLTTSAMSRRLNLAPAGFRTPGGFSNGLDDRPDLQKMLRAFGFDWVSSKYPPHPNTEPGVKPSEEILAGIVAAQQNAQPYRYPNGLLEIPMSPISDIGAFRTGRWQLDWFVEATRRSLQWAIENRGVFDFLAHPSCLYVVDPKFETLRMICQTVQSAGDRAEIVDLSTIASCY